MIPPVAIALIFGGVAVAIYEASKKNVALKGKTVENNSNEATEKAKPNVKKPSKSGANRDGNGSGRVLDSPEGGAGLEQPDGAGD